MKPRSPLSAVARRLLRPLYTLLPWGVARLYSTAVYAVVGYLLGATLFAVVTGLALTVTVLNILFGMGLLVMGVLMIPALMSADSGRPAPLILPVLSYPLVYLVALLGSTVLDSSDAWRPWALNVAVLPSINFLAVALILLRRVARERLSSRQRRQGGGQDDVRFE